MNKYIEKALELNEENTTIKKVFIDVIVDFEIDTAFLEEVEIRPIMTPEGEIDGQALGDYLFFIVQALSELDDAGLTVIEQHDSKSSETSKYFTLADEDQLKEGNMKYVIYLRISDHVPKLTPTQKKFINNKRKEDSNKLKVKWKLRQILVNKEHFLTYDEAAEYVGKKAIEYKKSLQ